MTFPEHWEVASLGQLGRFSKGGGGTKEDEVLDGVPCIRYGDLYSKYSTFITAARSFVSEERSNAYTPVFFGDVLFAGSGETIEEIGKSAVNLLEGKTCCGGDVLVFRPLREIDPRFLGYATDCSEAIDQKARMGRGVTVMHIYADELKHLRIALPPLSEQAAIVRFLDHADRRIRRAIRAKQKLIALLNEQKQAVIHRAVARGLDQNVRLKPSGVDWLGDVPVHWNTSRIKEVARMESGHTPTRSNPEHWRDDNDIPWVSLNDTKQLDRADYISDTALYVNALGLQNSSARMLPAGAVVFTRDAAVGKAAITTRRMAVSQHLIAWICGPRLLNSYLLHVIYAMKDDLRRVSLGATIPTIGMDDIRELMTPVPPLDEQRAIAAHLHSATRSVERSLVLLHEQIRTIREYSARLIADVVTGKLDISTASADLGEV